MTCRLLLAPLLLLAMEADAIACSCVRLPQDPAERQAFAEDDARGALALVEVSLVTAHDWDSERPQRLRVTRTLAGQAPSTFDVEMPDRTDSSGPDFMRCGMDAHIGDEPRLTLLYEPRRGNGGAMPRFRISDVCSSLWLEDGAYRASVIRAIRRRR